MFAKIAALTIATALGLTAQTVSTRVNADVPFAFEVRGMVFPAGQIEVSRTVGPNNIIVRNRAEGMAVHMLITSLERKPAAVNTLVFQKSGDRYYLVSVIDSATGLAYKGAPTRKQAESARAGMPETIHVATR